MIKLRTREIARSCKKILLILIFKLKVSQKRLFYKQLYFFVSSPYWGNIGDHAIFLSEKKILKECGLLSQAIEITSIEYPILKKTLGRSLEKKDVLFIDGGGNFGDTWPETMKRINDIVGTYRNNPIIIFPESWYFSQTPEGETLLKETQNVFNDHSAVILYARDSWSFEQMKNNLPQNDIRQSFDCVLLMNNYDVPHKRQGTVGLSLRNDKEAVEGVKVGKIASVLEKHNFKVVNIQNDCKCHISKHKRNKVFGNMLDEYSNVDFIVTDRFHGLIFSLVCNRPCIVIDNKTGKVHHFAEDIKNKVNGVYMIDSEEDLENLLRSDKLEMKIEHELKSEIRSYKMDIINSIKKYS